jgi:predicted Zn-dependent protease
MNSVSVRIVLLILFFSFLTAAPKTHAVTFIQDAEIIDAVNQVVKPIIKVAGLNHHETKVHIILNDEINAFVMDGKNIFVNTGLLTFSDAPEVLAGVIAHECGHISKGHVSARRAKIEELRKKSAFLFLTGIAASIATSSNIGVGTIAMGHEYLQQNYLGYSRIQEAAADQAAVNYMKKLNLPATGLLELLHSFKDHQRSFYGNISAYKRTHPLSSERIEFLRQHGAGNADNKSYLNENIKAQFKLAIFKLRAFILPAEQTLSAVKGDDPAALYAQAIAYYKKFQLPKSFSILDALIANYPANPFFLETKGQFLVESGKVSEGVEYYKKAVLLQKGQFPLLQAGLANAYLLSPKSGSKEWREAVNMLEKLALQDANNHWIFRQLGLGYGKLGEKTNSYLALALEQYLLEEKDNAKKFLRSAELYSKQENINNALTKQRIVDLQELLN